MSVSWPLKVIKAFTGYELLAPAIFANLDI
jgi:hypothetical protein